MTRTRSAIHAVSILLLSLLAACDRGMTESRIAAPDGLAPLLSAGADSISGRYVVVLRDEAGDAAADVAEDAGGRVHFTYGDAIDGFAASLDPRALDEVRRDPRVAYVAQDGWARMAETQPNPAWGLDRIDQRALPLDAAFTCGGTGEGVTAYVLDTGIRPSHAEFGGRATVGADLIGDGGEGVDCNGHGTHVAGTLAGATYGVARQARIVGVRVLGCGGSAPFSAVIAGVEWVTANARKPAVANMSLLGGYYPPLNDAVRASIASGVFYAVAAGNMDADACIVSPASLGEAVTVGATTQTDARAWFSNWGNCVDLFAPGFEIPSAWHTADTASHLLNGTSMATPHVAGVAALYLQHHPDATPAQVAAKLIATATPGRVTDARTGSPNRLLYAGLTMETPGAFMDLTPRALELSYVRIVGGGPQETTVSVPVTLLNAGTAGLAWTAVKDSGWLRISPAQGSLPAGASDTLLAGVDVAGVPPGVRSGRITVSDPAASNSPLQLGVSLRVTEALLLQHAVPRAGLSGGIGSRSYFAVLVPPEATRLTVAIYGEASGANLYVRRGDLPSQDAWDCRPNLAGSDETCVIETPEPGTWYVMLAGAEDYAGITLTASMRGAPAAPANLTATLTSATTVQLAWRDASFSETGFTLSRRTLAAPGEWGAWQDFATAPANAGGASSAGLARGTTVQHRVRACNADGCSAWIESGPVILAAPAAPPALAALAATPTSVRVGWTNGGGASFFSIGRRALAGTEWTAWQDAGSADSAATGFTSGGLTAGGTYQFRLRACNPAGCSAWIESAAVTTPASPIPAAPAGPSATILTPTAIRVAWTDASSNESSFTVSRRVLTGGTWSAWQALAAPGRNAVRYDDAGLAAGSTYHYRVRACSSAGCSAWAAAPAVALPPLPRVPAGVLSMPVSGTAARVDWTDGADETSYRVQRRMMTGGVWGAWEDAGTTRANAVTFTVRGLTAGGQVQFRVRACNAAGCSGWGYARILLMPIVPINPDGVTASALSATQGRVTWRDAGANETSFTVDRSVRGPTGTWAAYQNVAALPANATGFTDSTVESGGVYRYRIRACNVAGCSSGAPSPIITIP